MAIVVEGHRGRVYLAPTEEHECAANKALSEWKPQGSFVEDARAFTPCIYGIKEWQHLFTDRQLVALTTFSDLVAEAGGRVYQDALAAGMPDDQTGLDAGGTGARPYAEAIVSYLSFVVSRVADFGNSLCGWSASNQKVMHLFGKQSLPMVWDFSEANVLAGVVGGFAPATDFIAECILKLACTGVGFSTQQNAMSNGISLNKVVSTDPPYYDNVPYADLSDFFYIWQRRSLRKVFPEIFSTVAVPKIDELVAFSYRHEDGKDGAEKFFLEGMTQAMQRLSGHAHPAFPVTIYYAFKQAESDKNLGTVSTGWETFLDAVIRAGFVLAGTWPMRSEQEYRMRGMSSNALASSIVLVCRPRPADAPSISRRAFLRELNQVLPEALDEMTRGAGDERSPVAPVDLSQAIIGPGMAVFSKYAAVLEADGTPMSVRTALQIINRFFAEDDFDHDTQFCLHWFGQYGWKEGKFGEADTLSRSKGTSVEGVRQSGVLYATGGVVRLIKWPEYPADWDPQKDERLPIWELLHQLIRVFKADGERAAGLIVAAVPSKAEATRQLAYRLYTLCERAGWAEDARAYNEIITSWSAIEAAAAAAPTPLQADMFD
jgi:putative DNA methylase